MAALRTTLERIYRSYHRPEYLKTDPLCVVRRFRSKAELETVGLIAACLAYGRVDLIIRAIDRVTACCDNDPVAFATETDYRQKLRALRSFRHRFNSGHDMACLLEAVRVVRSEYGSLEGLFFSAQRQGDTTMRSVMDGFVSTLRNSAGRGGPGLGFLLPSPLSGSACKRMNMYFRWMVRADDGIDLGVWKTIDPAVLVVPVDTHVARAAKRLGLTARRAADWRMAEDITTRLREVDPSDPVRFDFSLCRYGMVESRAWAS